MKQQILITFLIILCYAGETHSQQRNIRDPKMGDTVLLFDWNRDGVKDTFVVKNRVFYNSGYPKYFIYDDLVIKMSNGKTFKLSENSNLVSEGIETDYINSFVKINKSAIIPNKYFWFINLSKNERIPLLFLSAGSLESSEDTPTLIVVKLNEQNNPYVAFEKQNFYIHSFEDLDKDMCKEVVGIICYGQHENEFIRTYDPFHVYKYKDAQFHLDTNLSKKYTGRYWDGWAGMDCSEEWEVLEHPKLKKPKVMKLEDAKKLARKLNKGRKIQGEE